MVIPKRVNTIDEMTNLSPSQSDRCKTNNPLHGTIPEILSVQPRAHATGISS